MTDGIICNPIRRKRPTKLVVYWAPLPFDPRVISELPKKTMLRTPIGQVKEPMLLQTFWDNLPDEFEAKDFKEIASSIGLTIPTAERYIRAWTGTRLEKVVRGKYRKWKRV